jgi:NitT/TauT family transport system substrate-binding protein
MQHLAKLSCAGAAVVASLAVTLNASADDLLKLAVSHRGNWGSAAPELGQQAGIFKKHGIGLDLLYPERRTETVPGVTSDGIDVELADDFLGVLRAYSKGAPVRIIGANTTGTAYYWYVLATSPIKKIKDISGRTIAYPTGTVSSRYDIFDFMKQYGIKPSPLATSGQVGTFNEVMLGHIDIGWAMPSFGMDAIEEGKIRVIARE